MQRDVELGPEHLVDRPGRAHLAAVGEPRDGAPGVEPVGLRLDPRVDDRVRVGGVAVLAPTPSSQPVGRAQKRPGERRESPRSLPAVLIATRQPSPQPPSTSAVRDEDVLEEDLGEAGLAVELGDRADRDAVGVEGEEEVGQPVVPLRLGVGAEQPERPSGRTSPATTRSSGR